MKLNYTDLRLGNMIYWPQRQSSPDEMHTVRPGDFVTFQKYRFELKGVPITEEWLERLGASKFEYYSIGNIFIVLNGQTGDFFCCLDPEDGSTVITNIRYVHQLQNIIQALTGQELTIKTK